MGNRPEMNRWFDTPNLIQYNWTEHQEMAQTRKFRMHLQIILNFILLVMEMVLVQRPNKCFSTVYPNEQKNFTD